MDIRKSGLFILGSVLSLSATAQSQNTGGSYYDNNRMPTNTVYQQTQVMTVGQRRTGVSTILGASVVPYKEVTFSAETSGRVEYLSGQEGDRFNQDQVLVALDTDELLARREQVVADLNTSYLRLRNTQMQYGREWWSPQSRSVNKMPGMGLPSLFDQFFTKNVASSMGYGNPWLERYSDLYSSGSKMGQAQSQHRAALSKLNEIDARLRDTRTISPFNGVIVEKMVEVGDTVSMGQPLIRYADLNNLQLSVEVPSRLITEVHEGMVIPAMLDFNNQFVNVRLAQIYPLGNVKRHTITVKFDLPVGITAWPGTYAEVMLPESSENNKTVIEIPSSAVIKRGSLPVVYVIKDNKRELRLVRLGASYVQDRITVLAGLSLGDQILVNPPPGVVSGWHKEPEALNP